MNLKDISADKLVPLYKNRDLTVTEVIKSVYEEIERTDKDARFYLDLSEPALSEARRMDASCRGRARNRWPGFLLPSKTT
jgi:Asp-tRNA(Asn)/Glu-tRNA(Gln) amidotransferase A subunit family amidase